ncbi:MAG: hypothetical protein MIK27_12220 [Sphingomonas sanguinis]|jgi:hypothetical protein|uniref:Uncharacterized protein n=1 Tax=Sphingomonas sanguinis TaxID=33051 RepID=A0A7Y7QVT2_9SPHN|nr:hypothetical protein [Sphingomonas sanguinis]MBZ6382255.1 hypothetical protein [Sphingomonas sanguinis]NNG50841.1 hypothetical protein [Sphingomonas sanguinis]NNG54371.1 hypothetical protein [Sphingomonas sanguinis]NVP31553.1 hypothetical protein [Sphingomonas sanguinis]
MFEIGRDYKITTGLGDYEGSSVSTVVAFEAPLLKVVAHGMETIFNTASPSFVSAEKQLTSEEEMERWKDLPDYLRPETPPAG